MNTITNKHVKEIHKAKHLPLGELVYQALRKDIILGKLEANVKLNEVELANTFNVSPTPVREAFRKLQADNLVEIIPYKGVTVKGIATKEIIAIYQCREVLEGLGARLAAESISKEALAQLQEVYQASCNTQDNSEIVKLNTLFHELIIQASGNSKISEFVNSFSMLINRDMYLTSYDPHRSVLCQSEHKQILDAIAAGNGAAAENCMRMHIANAFLYKSRRDSFAKI